MICNINKYKCNPLRQQRVALQHVIGHYAKDCPNSTGTGPAPDQTLPYSAPTTVTETVTASYSVSKFSKYLELAKVKQTS